MNKKLLGAVFVVVLAVVGYFWGPSVAKCLNDAVAPIVSDVAPDQPH